MAKPESNMYSLGVPQLLFVEVFFDFRFNLQSPQLDFDLSASLRQASKISARVGLDRMEWISARTWLN